MYDQGMEKILAASVAAATALCGIDALYNTDPTTTDLHKALRIMTTQVKGRIDHNRYGTKLASLPTKSTEVIKEMWAA